MHFAIASAALAEFAAAAIMFAVVMTPPIIR
jgi:hypothetical protein